MDIEKICRCCLALDMPLLSIYEGGSAGMGCVGDMLRQIAKLKPVQGDNMPEKACLQCISEINRCYVFQMKCENSNRTLRQLLPDAVPEILDLEVTNKVEVSSCAVQTDDKIYISTIMQTEVEEQPLVSHNSIQTHKADRTPVSHKEIQTESQRYDDVTKDFLIYDKFENTIVTTKKRLQTSPMVTRQLSKRLCEDKTKNENMRAIKEALTNSQRNNEFVLLEDSNIDTNCTKSKIYDTKPVDNQKVLDLQYLENKEEQISNEIYQHNYGDKVDVVKYNEQRNIIILPNENDEMTKAMQKNQKFPSLSRANDQPTGQYKCSQCIMTFVDINFLRRHLQYKHDIKDAEIVIEYLPTAEPDRTTVAVDEPSSSMNIRNNTQNLLILGESARNVEDDNFLLLEDSNADSNCSEEVEIYMPNIVDKQKDTEYYEHEIDNLQDDENNLLYQDNENLQSDGIEIITTLGTTIRAKGQYKCSQCIMTFFSIRVLKRHLANRHNIKDADIVIDYLPATENEQASVAEDEPSSSDNLAITTVALTAENVAKPQLLPRERVSSSVSEDTLINIKYFCDYCQAGFAQRKTLTYHMKHQVCMTNNFKCNNCDRIFVSEEKLKSHKYTHENQHKCLECDTVCKTIEELSQHMIAKHKRNARNQCHVCKKVFTMKTSLINHLRIHSGEKPFLCTICGKSFRQNSNLRQHLIRHVNEKNFKCDMCPNAYVTKAELFSHKRTHTGEQPFQCDICDVRFTSSCSLQKHLRKHTGERPYACEYCPMRFAALNVLKNHRRIHTGEKPYKCAYCPKSFTQKGDCLMHERTHVNKGFKCQCSARFSKKCNFRQHIKTHHPDLNENEVQALLNKPLGENSETEEYRIMLEDSDGLVDMDA